MNKEAFKKLLEGPWAIQDHGPEEMAVSIFRMVSILNLQGTSPPQICHIDDYDQETNLQIAQAIVAIPLLLKALKTMTDQFSNDGCITYQAYEDAITILDEVENSYDAE